MDIIFLGIGIVIGFIIGWFIAKYQGAMTLKGVSEVELKQRYVPRALFENLQSNNDVQKDDLIDKENELRAAASELAAQKQMNLMLNERLDQQRQEVYTMQTQFKLEFEQIANKLLEEKSEKFTRQNKEQLDTILSPFQDQLHKFENSIEQRLLRQTENHISLKEEIKHLRHLNLQLSNDASSLVNALRGENKTQGDWGEFRLELLLERANLDKHLYYQTQSSFQDAQGNQKRPDFIINLPQEKQLVIDSKVSLKHYEAYFNETDKDLQQQYLKQHLNSIRSHIKDLSGKKYQQLYQINSPDYVLMFIPIEPALTLALQEDNNIFLEALDNNIVLVSTTTLLATMRTVSFIWKQEKQKQNVLEIARQSGLLYDKFNGFVEDMVKIGDAIQGLEKVYDASMNKLSTGKGNLIRRAEKIKSLGAKASKSLPNDLIKWSEE